MSKFLRHESCPTCGSADNLAIYDDHEHCFSEGCDHHKSYDYEGATKISSKAKHENEHLVKNIVPLPTKTGSIKERGLDGSTVEKYKVTTDYSDEVEAIFPRFDSEGRHVANQIRLVDKEFRSQGDPKSACLFGQQLYPEGGRSITITEGYYDTLAAFQMTGSRYPNVGVQSASTAKTEVVKSFEYLNSFDEIILNFDNDEPGQKAAKDCAVLFNPGKVRILSLSKHKDANDYLMNGLSKEYINEWFRAPPYMPDGLLLGNDPALLDNIINYDEPESIPFPWEGLNRSLYGLRLGELTLLMADTGAGKTTFMKEMEYGILMNEDLIARKYGAGFLHLEEPKRDTAIGLMSIYKNKPLHLPDVQKTTEELIEAYNAVINNDRVVIYDHFGSNDIDIILSKVRHMAALGCKYIFLDHLSIIVSDQSGDERKQLDEISTKLKTLTMNLNICLVCVIHINRQGLARGSAGPEQVANNVVRLVRDKNEVDEWRRNITVMIVEKCRLSGRTGPAAWVYYNSMTGRLEEITDRELIDQFERGGSLAGHEFAVYDGE